jgi:hypothetical protein
VQVKKDIYNQIEEKLSCNFLTFYLSFIVGYANKYWNGKQYPDEFLKGTLYVGNEYDFAFLGHNGPLNE